MRKLATQQILEEQYGRPTFLGTIAAGTAAKSNADTTVPFTIAPGSRLLIQVIGATGVFVKIGPTGTTATLAGCVSLSPSEKFYTCLTLNDSVVSALTATSTATVNVFLME
jgi:hypothetical protein